MGQQPAAIRGMAAGVEPLDINHNILYNIYILYILEWAVFITQGPGWGPEGMRVTK